MRKKKVILTIVATVGMISVFFAVVSMGKNNEELDRKNDISTNISVNIDNGQDSNKENDNKQDKENVKIDFNIDLSDEQKLLNVISKSFKKYYNINVPVDGSVKFNLSKKTSEKIGDEILNASYVGKLNNKQYYLNIVINKTQKCMERIDKYDYSVEEKEEPITEREAKEIAEKFLKQVDGEKYSFIKDIEVSQNSRDGYVVVFKDKNYEQNNSSIIIAVNPYSSMVSSFMIFWK